ncbi:hypothetical protein [Sphingomonas sp. RB1R13]|uniref:hypothetical protein n=1 Tax=Sphingomonas sp. RB1R13 TaxID=3096159 RepID=UPI002FC96D0D
MHLDRVDAPVNREGIVGIAEVIAGKAARSQGGDWQGFVSFHDSCNASLANQSRNAGTAAVMTG